MIYKKNSLSQQLFYKNYKIMGRIPYEGRRRGEGRGGIFNL